MRILQIAHGFFPDNIAGTEVYTYNLSRELAKRHDVCILHRIGDLKIKEYDISQTNFDGVKVYRINNNFRHCSSFEMTYRDPSIADKLAEIIQEIKPDLAHIQHFLYLSAEIVRVLKKRNIPLVFTLHDYWLLCPQGQLLRKDLKVCDNQDSAKCLDCIEHQLAIKKNVFRYYYFFKKILPEYLVQSIKNRYLGLAKSTFLTDEKAKEKLNQRREYMKDICDSINLFISPSRFLREKFIEFGIPQEKIILSRYAFNLDYFLDSQKHRSSKLRFAFIGNIMPSKGLHVLIQAFNKMSNEKAELKIYGRVYSYKGLLSGYLKELKQLARNKDIRFMGSFDNRNINSIFKEIDVLVVPSVWPENSPLVIQEASASKTVVLASNIGGIPELITDGKNGLLFSPASVSDLYEKMKDLIEHPDKIDEIKNSILPPEDIKSASQELEKIYSRLLKK